MGAVVVDVEDGDLAICPFYLDSCDVVGVGNTDYLPIFCFEAFIYPYD